MVCPSSSPLRTTARITALSPGQSPPPVSTPMRAMARILAPASNPRRSPGGERVLDRDGPAEVEALGEVDAELADGLEDVLVRDELGEARRAEAGGTPPAPLDDEPVRRVLAHAADELAVDLEDVEVEVLERRERGEAGPEVVEREPAADTPQRRRERACGVEVDDRGRLGDLDQEPARRHGPRGE